MFDSAGFVPRRAQILFLPNAVASGSAGDVANGGALGIVADCAFVAVVDRLVDSGISWLGVWTVFLQFISVTEIKVEKGFPKNNFLPFMV